VPIDGCAVATSRDSGICECLWLSPGLTARDNAGIFLPNSGTESRRRGREADPRSDTAEPSEPYAFRGARSFGRRLAAAAATCVGRMNGSGFSRRRHITWAGVVCAILVVAGTTLDPARELLDFRLILFLWIEICLSGLLIPALGRITGAIWLSRFERMTRILSGSLPMAAILLFAALVTGELISPAAARTAGFQSWWLHPTFLLARSALYLICWVLLARAPLTGFRLSKGSVRRVGAGWAFLFLGGLAVSFWLASVDWIVALSDEWQTTLVTIYNFSGLFLTAAVLLGYVSTAWPRLAGINESNGPAAFYDISRFIFFTSCFWVCIWFCQYLLIGYVEIPSGSAYYVRRVLGPWGGIFFLVPVLNWFIPCLILLSRRARMDQRSLWQVSILVLAGRWFDMYQLMLADRAVFNLSYFIFDLAPTLLVFSIWLARGEVGREEG
jgi:hypothetical protein